MITVTIDAPTLARPLCVPKCPKCGFPMNVHFAQEAIVITFPPPERRKTGVSVFGHCARCMHLEHLTTQEVNLEQTETVQPVPRTEPAAGSVLGRSAAGG